MTKSAYPSRIFLVGPMGAGKTTIGAKLAEQLEKNFVDSDREIEANTGATIPLIFELEGEQGFRKRESQAIQTLTKNENIVLATGGGAILSEENRLELKTHGFVIYLQATLDQLLERTQKDKNRPLLQTPDPRATLANILETREPFYKDVADLIFETDKKAVKDIIVEILDHLEHHPKRISA